MTVYLRLAAAVVFGLGTAGWAWAATPIEDALQVSAGSEAYAPYFASAASTAALNNAVAHVSAGEVATAEASDGACSECEDLLDCMCCGPVWYASVGTIILHRSRPESGTTVAANPAGTRFASASEFTYGWNWGPDVTLARRLASGDILEGRFFMNDDMDSEHTFVTPGNFIGAGFTGPGGTLFNGHSLNKLYSAELNLRRQVRDQLKLMVGFRWLELSDLAAYRLNGNVATGRYEYDNRLYGGQVGADWALADQSNPLQINVVGKAGLYANVADGGIFEFQGNNFIGSFVDSSTMTAFVGDVGISAAYMLTDRVAIRGGYQLLWVEGVALGAEAMARSLLNPSLLRRIEDDGVFYQGVTMSFDVVW